MFGASSSGKTQGFDPCIRGFESLRPSHFILAGVENQIRMQQLYSVLELVKIEKIRLFIR